MVFFRKRASIARGCRVSMLSVILASSFATVAFAQNANPGPTLYQRLGGYDGVASYIALVFPRVAQHPELAHMFRGHGKDSQQRQFQPGWSASGRGELGRGWPGPCPSRAPRSRGRGFSMTVDEPCWPKCSTIRASPRAGARLI